MKINAMAGRRARIVGLEFDKASLALIIPVILASRAGVSGTYPFGVSMFAAILPSYFGAAAVILGSLTLGVISVKYIIVTMAFLALCYLKKLDRIANTALLLLLTAICGIVQMLFFDPSLAAFLRVLAESVSTGLLYYIFASLQGKYKGQTRERQMARLLILGAAVGGFSGLTLPPMLNLNILAGILLSMLISSSLTLTQSVTASIVIALVSSLDSAATMSVVCLFALSALFCAMLRELGRWGTALGFLCGSALTAILGDSFYSARLFAASVVASTIIYLILPDFTLSYIQDRIRSISGLSEANEEYKRVLKHIKNVTKQHRRISSALKNINDEIIRDEVYSEKKALYQVTSVVMQRADGNGSISGDCFLEFDADNNRHCAILCDGMGKGIKAYRESKMTAELLSEFLMSGFLKDKAVGMLNTALAIKGDDESFSTVDLFELDKTSGDAEFLKIGSAETYIKHKDEVETLASYSLPVGILDDIRSNTETRRLFAGDIVVMVSDGVGEAGYGVLKGEWIKRMIKSSNSDINRLAEELLAEAEKRCYPEKDDDMTVVVMRIERARESL